VVFFWLKGYEKADVDADADADDDGGGGGTVQHLCNFQTIHFSTVEHNDAKPISAFCLYCTRPRHSKSHFQLLPQKDFFFK
jgi:hypothetical protein